MLSSLSANCHIRSAQSRCPLDLITSTSHSSRETLRSTLLSVEPRLRTLILHHKDCMDEYHEGMSQWEGPDRVKSIMDILQNKDMVSLDVLYEVFSSCPPPHPSSLMSNTFFSFLPYFLSLSL